MGETGDWGVQPNHHQPPVTLQVPYKERYTPGCPFRDRVATGGHHKFVPKVRIAKYHINPPNNKVTQQEMLITEKSHEISISDEYSKEST